MNAYCLFCRTEKAGSVAAILEKRGIERAFSPSILRRKRVKGENIDIQCDLLPGYVFAFSEKDLEDFDVFRGIPGALRWLKEDSDRENPRGSYGLTGKDLEFAMNLYRRDGYVGKVVLLKVGDQVILDDPLFRNCSGHVVRIDYKKQRASVEYLFAGTTCHTWVACDVVNMGEGQENGAYRVSLSD